MKQALGDLITLSDDDWGVQSPPKRIGSNSITILSFGEPGS